VHVINSRLLRGLAWFRAANVS
ncbi:MAG: hypothetical protein QOD31_2476, partial [Pseudonocardiales bacterium]|nr:hypothetical protein [Pseudonocardiales bacterium]